VSVVEGKAGLRVGVFGAGAIGVHVGLRLAGAGAQVTLLGRQALVDLHASGSLHTASLDARGGGPPVPAPAEIRIGTEPSVLTDSELILLCVKSGDTQAVIPALHEMTAGTGAPVISLQNGLRNPGLLRAAGLEVLAGMVSFNVNRVDEEGRAVYRQATTGPIMVEASRAHAAPLARLEDLCVRAQIEFELHTDMRGVATGKLLLNLNNAICSLAGVSIADSLRSRPLRRCFAASMREALRIYAAAGERPARVGKLPPRMIAGLLPLPDAIVLRVAKSMITVDPRARSSTLQDLERGKLTEIDALNGELVALADRVGVPCPINRWIVDQIHVLEGQAELEFFEADVLWARIKAL